MAILLAAGISNTVLLTTRYCFFPVEAIPIIITCLFGVSAIDQAIVYMYNQRKIPNESPLMQQQRDPLIQAQPMDYCTAAKPTKDYMVWLVKFYNMRMSTVGVVMLCVLDCIPFALCALWIYALVILHAASGHLQEPLCKTRFWYSLAQCTLFTPISCCGIFQVVILVRRVCKRNCNI